MKQKILTLILALFASVAAGAYDFEVDGIYYNITSSTDLTVGVTSSSSRADIAPSNSYSGAVSIPAIVKYGEKIYNVTSIERGAFIDCKCLTSVLIPNSVSNIADLVFSGCFFAKDNFVNNSSCVSDSYWNASIHERETSDGLIIDKNKIVYCRPNAASIAVPEDVTAIGYGAFSKCVQLASIKVAEGNAIYDSRGNCNAIIETSSNELVLGCKNTVIPNSVTSIGDKSFENAVELKSLELSKNIKRIGSFVFYGCTNLNAVYYTGSLAEWLTIQLPLNTCGSICNGNSAGLYIDGELVTDVIIPKEIKQIYPHVFCHYDKIKRVVINNEITDIPKAAFAECANLTSVEIPNSVTNIGSSAFAECANLTSVEIPNSVTIIDSNVFAGCTSLTSVEIPNSVTNIGSSAFANCANLTSVEIPNSVTIIDSNVFAGCTSLTSVEIPNSVTNIGSSAFANCANLTSVEIPNSVTIIGEGVFFNCTKLASVTISKSLKKITLHAFKNCTSLTSVEIPQGVTHINAYAFLNCDNLTSVRIPNSVSSMYGPVFYGCTKLSKIYTDNSRVSLIKSSVGTNVSYIVPCTLYDQYVSAGLKTEKEHSLVKTEAVAETCTAAGCKEFYTCSKCNKHYSDADAIVEIDEDSWVIAAMGHSWGTWTTTKESTCVDKGLRQRVCANDVSHVEEAYIAINSGNHANIVTDSYVAETCTETGLTEGSHCEACSTIIVAQTTKEAIGHQFSEYIYNNDATTDTDGTETAECEHHCGATDTRTAEGTKLTPTGVTPVHEDSQKVVKTVENGKIVIIRDNKKYDLTGREL